MLRKILSIALLSAFIVLGFGVSGGPIGISGAYAQQMSNDPFRFRVRNNPMAANLAIMMRQIDNESSSSSSSGSIAAGSSSVGVLNQYSSTTIGNLTDIQTILEQGSQGYVNLDTQQDGAGSSQTSGSEGTQVLGGSASFGSGDANSVTVVEPPAEDAPTVSSESAQGG